MNGPIDERGHVEALAIAYVAWAADEDEVREAIEWSEALIGDTFADETDEERQANDAWYEEWRSQRLDGDRRRR